MLHGGAVMSAPRTYVLLCTCEFSDGRRLGAPLFRDGLDVYIEAKITSGRAPFCCRILRLFISVSLPQSSQDIQDEKTLQRHSAITETSCMGSSDQLRRKVGWQETSRLWIRRNLEIDGQTGKASLSCTFRNGTPACGIGSGGTDFLLWLVSAALP